mmetsp:Transcript_8008/g.14110  ORF Transcript_8008/g.14110 Transcript_8008/m.14110 type:complete len:114 (+) Transcript_8008:338-679(+)
MPTSETVGDNKKLPWPSNKSAPSPQLGDSWRMKKHVFTKRPISAWFEHGCSIDAYFDLGSFFLKLRVALALKDVATIKFDFLGLALTIKGERVLLIRKMGHSSDYASPLEVGE